MSHRRNPSYYKYQEKYHRLNSRRLHLWKRYKLTEDAWEALFQAQKGKCGICGRANRPLVVDHCHMTGKVRGLLCRRCNSVLGYWHDDISLVENALEYLREER